MYIEKVFGILLAEDLFIGFVLSQLLKNKNLPKILFFSFSDAFLYCLFCLKNFPLYPYYFIKLFLFPLAFMQNVDFQKYLTNGTLFGLVFLALRGIGKLLPQETVPFGTVGTGCIVLLLLPLFKNIRTVKKDNENLRKVTITDGRKTIKITAYYDSGNQVYAEKGEPVMIVNTSVYNSFSNPTDEEIIVDSLGGIRVLPAKKIAVLSEKGKLVPVKMALSERKIQYKAILHSLMTEEYYETIGMDSKDTFDFYKEKHL